MGADITESFHEKCTYSSFMEPKFTPINQKRHIQYSWPFIAQICTEYPLAAITLLSPRNRAAIRQGSID